MLNKGSKGCQSNPQFYTIYARFSLSHIFLINNVEIINFCLFVTYVLVYTDLINQTELANQFKPKKRGNKTF